MLENFIYAKQKSLFEEKLNNGEVLDEAIVFIEDTKEIWNHGTYFDGSTFDSSNIELSILNIIDTTLTKTEAAATYQPIGDYATKSELPTKVSQLENDADYLPNTITISNGVYVVDINGKLHDPNTFTGTADDVTGIGLVTDKVKMIVALDEWYSRLESTAWNGNIRSAWGGYNKTVTGCWIGTSGYLNDFDGEANTDAIIAQLKDTTDSYSQYYTGAPAAEYCRAYSKGYKDVGSWYLPAAGELNEIVLNKDAINAILTKLGKNNLSKNSYTWSSSQFNSDDAWYYYWSYSSWDRNDKYANGGVRPICKSELKKPLKERIKDLESNKADKTEIPTKVSLLENDANYIQDVVIPENGIYIYDTDGRFTLPENWNTTNNSKAVGVAILGDDCRFVVAKENAKSSTVIGGGYGTDIASLTNYTSQTEAAKDFAGITNTQVIIDAIGQTNDGYRTGSAAQDCVDYIFPNGQAGYLGAAGEWKLARSYKDELNSALELIGGTKMTEGGYWTSTECSSDDAWLQWFDSLSNFSSYGKYNNLYVRAFLALEIKPLKERVSELELNYFKWSKLILPSFTIAGVSYDFEEGMTWEDWVNSEYNDGSFTISDGTTLKYYGFTIKTEGGVITNLKDVIIANGIYYQRYDTGGSN